MGCMKINTEKFKLVCGVVLGELLHFILLFELCINNNQGLSLFIGGLYTIVLIIHVMSCHNKVVNEVAKKYKPPVLYRWVSYGIDIIFIGMLAFTEHPFLGILYVLCVIFQYIYRVSVKKAVDTINKEKYKINT